MRRRACAPGAQVEFRGQFESVRFLPTHHVGSRNQSQFVRLGRLSKSSCGPLPCLFYLFNVGNRIYKAVLLAENLDYSSNYFKSKVPRSYSKPH